MDARIDGLVYELYGVTEEEVGVVEGRLKEAINLAASAIVVKR